MKMLYESEKHILLSDTHLLDAFGDPFYIWMDLGAYRLSFWKKNRNFSRTKERVWENKKVPHWIPVSDLRRGTWEFIQGEFVGLPSVMPDGIFIW